MPAFDDGSASSRVYSEYTNLFEYQLSNRSFNYVGPIIAYRNIREWSVMQWDLILLFHQLILLGTGRPMHLCIVEFSELCI